MPLGNNECVTYCLSCDSCESCNRGCQNGCDKCESFCEVGKENSDNGFTWMRCGSQGEIIGPGYFDLDVWHDAIDAINAVWNKGTKQNASGNRISKTNFNFLSADEFNRVSEAARCKTTVFSEGIIYGSYFD